MKNKKSKQSSVQKLISFPENMYQVLERKAKRRGVLVPEYVRHLIMNDLESELDVEIASEELEKELEKAFDDIKHGRIYNLEYDADNNEFLFKDNVSRKDKEAIKRNFNKKLQKEI